MQMLLLAVQDLCDLNRIQGGAFQKLIAADEHLKTLFVVAGNILADASDEHIVFARRVNRHRIDFFGRIVAQFHARRRRDDRTCLFRGDVFLEFKVQGLGMSAENRNADRSSWFH